MRNRRCSSVSFGDDEESFDEALSIATKLVPETELTQLETVYVLQPANECAEVTEVCELTCGRLVASGLAAQTVSWPPNVKDPEPKAVLCLLKVEESFLTDISATDFDVLRKTGVMTKVCTCDVSDKIAMIKVIADCTAELPPIKGVIQSASVLQDSIYENMTHDRWSTSI
ncbi:hypothetical protein AYO20_10945 [Fonsecaea nubica]|uniref:Ketoreductase (KR) domain-containing protein n=1 Tax=Fonsecaea nubica TaxID=856822 RepID=A0A178C3N3_9EURO|nr:hypothetical protein AYO20_10945 [Fonsecaea nubica]OAL23695.1 hypothetical protein AYO20_10945 [Fonsecaea nubica]